MKTWLASPCDMWNEEAALRRNSALKPAHFPAGVAHFVGKQEAHQSHQLWLYKGLLYCKRCGAYADTRARLLAQTCRQVANSSGLQVLAALAEDKKPRKLKQWPDEAAEAEEAVNLELGASTPG